MRTPWVVGVAFTGFLAMAATPAAAGPKRSIVRIQSGLDGWSTIRLACSLVGCRVAWSLDTLPDAAAVSSLFLVYDLPDTIQPGLLGIAAIESDLPARVEDDHGGHNDQSGCWGAAQATAGVLDELWDRTPVTYYGTTAWEAYLGQAAADIVRVRETHCAFGTTGGVTVAVIDTGVDRAHPTLQPVLTDGYDFTRNQDGGYENADVDQATAGVLDGIYGVNQVTAAALDQATAGVLDDSGFSHFGHGTMVAGVVHLVAPTARIMPLKAFGPDGQGYTSDILRAIRYAVRKEAKVINMSFSRATRSAELERAIDFATSRGLIAIASAGNDGSSSPRYPAAYANVMSVASTANDDTRSSFSNYGSSVEIAAPGEAIITTYPWGSFAAAWGTSFSTPMVSGGAALVAGMESTATQAEVSSALANARYLTPELGHGRLDLYQAVEAGRALFPDAPMARAAESCESSAVDWSPAP
jgi:subtilase family protein